MSAVASTAEVHIARGNTLLSSVGTNCLLFAVFAALLWAIPIGTMAAIVGNADFQALMWMTKLWAMLTAGTIAAGAAVYATGAYALDWYRQREAHSAIAARFEGMNIEDPDATLVTTGRRPAENDPTPQKNAVPSNVVHADFRRRLRNGFNLLAHERNKIAS